MVVGAIARSTYCYRSRANELPDLYARASELIKKIFHQHKGLYEYKRIMLALRNVCGEADSITSGRFSLSE